MKRKPSTDEASIVSQLRQRPSDGDRRQVKRRKATPPLSQPSFPQQHVKTGETASLVNSIEDWLNSISENSIGLDDAAQMATVSDAASTSTRPLRSSATSRSRSSSPSKLTSQNYRAQVLKRVDIHVDVDVPDATREQLLPPAPAAALSNDAIQSVAGELYKGARELLERQTANEAEWVGLLNTAIHGLMREIPDQLCCLPNRDWQAALKPVAYFHNFASVLPRKRPTSTSSPANILHPGHPDYPSPDQSTTTTFANQPHMPPPAQKLQLEPAPARLQPRTPRPDLCVGLSDSDASWDKDHEFWVSAGLRGKDIKDILVDLQAAAGSDAEVMGTLISDPCTASPSGMRFPFLVVEVKSGGSASIADAENQSAVSGECALGILRALATEERRPLVERAPAGTNNAADTLESRSQSRSPLSNTSSFRLRTFSLTTEGPAHVLWAHHPEPTGSSMVWLGAYRVTNGNSAAQLVRMLANVLVWGATDLKRWVREGIATYLTVP
ncbi:hypothetical protein W97_07749 [Coniosporium apollinis CBS 100218]|uniref:Uncharacterized protein n=1 Tax=Coniosporium apollinis (strain CBS 100218) TaxID=1168221 RepID=R7Z2K4_CONA1|nr:uncharacterized protein W97_07749 [Coniosporium apollinis CBS 100218]EON68425.1 hypothetical protein W97_07749 [Coniosporium apollinis CBS 100218]